MPAHIYLVEDTADTLRMMTWLLQSSGHRVSGFVNAEPAIAAAVTDRPDLILMDIQLAGGIDGYQALVRLRADHRLDAIPTIAVTAFAMVGDREQALRKGFAGYLSKPVDPYTFVAQVDQNLPPHLHGSPAGPAPEPVTSEPAGVARGTGFGAVRASHVLVVDDLPSNNEMLASILQPHGYSVAGTSTIAAALAAARTDRPDLILSDIHLRHESGWDLRRQLLGDPLLAGIPFAFTTATAADRDDVGESVEVIRRPIDPVAFLSTVRRLTNTPPEG